MPKLNHSRSRPADKYQGVEGKGRERLVRMGLVGWLVERRKRRMRGRRRENGGEGGRRRGWCEVMISRWLWFWGKGIEEKDGVIIEI